MGAEAKTKAVVDGVEHEGQLLLETGELIFRAPGLRLKIPLAKAKASAQGDILELRHGRQTARFALGEKQAAKWLDKIQHPKGLLDKLGVQPEHAVAVIAIDDAGFHADLESRLNKPPVERLKQNLDFVFLGAASPAALGQLARARAAIHDRGAVWVVYPKGVKTITQGDVLRAIRELGLKDVKVTAFSPTHTALKAMIPLAARR